MSPTLEHDEIVVLVKTKNIDRGDLIGFYYQGKILLKRVIALPGDWVNISEDGTVYVNDTQLEEPYIDAKAFGQCDLKLPYQVPESSYFLMGDHRETSVDSRSSAVGTVTKEQIVGKIVFCVWPMSDFGAVN